MTGDFTGNVITADDLSWAIINNNNFILELPSFSRVIHVKKCNNLDDRLKRLIFYTKSRYKIRSKKTGGK